MIFAVWLLGFPIKPLEDGTRDARHGARGRLAYSGPRGRAQNNDLKTRVICVKDADSVRDRRELRKGNGRTRTLK